MYAEERLKAEMVQDAMKKLVRPSQCREMAKSAVVQYVAGSRLACLAFGISESCYRYEAKLSSETP